MESNLQIEKPAGGKNQRGVLTMTPTPTRTKRTWREVALDVVEEQDSAKLAVLVEELLKSEDLGREASSGPNRE